MSGKKIGAFTLTGRSVHIWPVKITAPDSLLFERFWYLLAQEERQRADRFCFEHLKRNFVSIRGSLRVLLGAYLDIDPAKLLFEYGSNGKPALLSDASIDFNLSHSGEMAVLAFTSGCELGVDLERICSLPNLHDIATHFFCPEETAELIELPLPQQDEAFFSCWTRKEAYLKCVGGGLSIPLDSFRVTLRPDEPAQIKHVEYGKSNQSWTLHDLRLIPGYAAALAYQGSPRPLSIWPLTTPEALPKTG